MKRRIKINKITTKILEQIVAREGMTEHNSDYGQYIEEIQQELYRRYNKQGAIENLRREKDLRDYELHTYGRQCTHCHKCYPLDTIEENFYKVKVKTDAPRYRPRCKACHVSATRRRRGKAEISIETKATIETNDHGIDEIPF